MGMNRRNFVGILPSAAFLLMGSQSQGLGKNKSLPISCSEYDWFTFYKRDGKNWGEDPDACLAEFSDSKIPGLELSLKHPYQLKKLIPYLKKYQIQLPSVYIGSSMHEESDAKKSSETILEIAEIAKSLGTEIIVTNPNPIQGGSDQLKNDQQLSCQSTHLEYLGKSLRKLGIKLAYHTHDVELKAGAREFHHVLQNTSAESLSFCMDVHWIYRGSGNSQLAVFDTLKMYGDRIISFHLRQSKNGIWTETFEADGDIDYVRFANEVKRMGINAHLVIEQCLEEQTVRKLDVVEAHKINLREINNLFNS
jgi:inosose dehydratase